MFLSQKLFAYHFFKSLLTTLKLILHQIATSFGNFQLLKQFLMLPNTSIIDFNYNSNTANFARATPSTQTADLFLISQSVNYLRTFEWFLPPSQQLRHRILKHPSKLTESIPRIFSLGEKCKIIRNLELSLIWLM